LKLWRLVVDRFGEKPDVVREATGRVDALSTRAARITLKRASTATDSVRFEIDGAAAPLDLPILVDAGPHTLSASAEGHPTQRVDVIVRDGEQRQVEFDPGKRLEAGVQPATKSDTQTTSPIVVTPDEDTSMRTAGFILGGIGIGGLVLFGVSAPIIATAESDIDEACPTRRGCNEDAIAASDRGKTWLVPNTIGLIAGVVGVGLGITLLTLGTDEDPVQVTAGPQHVGATGRF